MYTSSNPELPYAAPPQEVEQQAEMPDFRQHAAYLEHIAAAGVETPRGVETYGSRVGIEVEFGLYDPVKVKEYLATEDITEQQRVFFLERIQNRDQLDSCVVDDGAVLAAQRAAARTMVESLPASNAAEEAKRQTWLSQVDSFNIRDILNFRLYSEFSKPTLGDATPPDGTMAELDVFSDRQGWLEFRFGKGILQTGYYDNEHTSEIRIAPVAPAEALRRQEIIAARATELATEYGLLFVSDSSDVHPNISMYTPDEQGVMQPVIGHSEDRQERTIDSTSGIVAAYEDGLFLHAKDMPHDFNFGPYASGNAFSLGPTRKNVRILDGRVELRANFRDTAQGVTAMMAGMLYGLRHGRDGLRDAGYTPTHTTQMFAVSRNEGFQKERDLQIQRAFEHAARADDGSFVISMGWGALRGRALAGELMSDIADMRDAPIINDVVFSAVRLDSEGIPYIAVDALAAAERSLEGVSKEAFERVVSGGSLLPLAGRLSQRLGRVRLRSTTAIVGNTRYVTETREQGLARVAGSPIADLAYQGQADMLAGWLRQGQAMYDYLRVR